MTDSTKDEYQRSFDNHQRQQREASNQTIGCNFDNWTVPDIQNVPDKVVDTGERFRGVPKFLPIGYTDESAQRVRDLAEEMKARPSWQVLRDIGDAVLRYVEGDGNKVPMRLIAELKAADRKERSQRAANGKRFDQAMREEMERARARAQSSEIDQALDKLAERIVEDMLLSVLRAPKSKEAAEFQRSAEVEHEGVSQEAFSAWCEARGIKWKMTIEKDGALVFMRFEDRNNISELTGKGPSPAAAAAKAIKTWETQGLRCLV
jgi:hypothetical protein